MTIAKKVKRSRRDEFESKGANGQKSLTVTHWSSVLHRFPLFKFLPPPTAHCHPGCFQGKMNQGNPVIEEVPSDLWSL